MLTTIDAKTALVLIDLQNGIVQLPLPYPINQLLDKANKLIEAFRKVNLPVVLVNVKPSGAFTQLRIDAQRPAVPPLPEWFEISDRINTHPADIRITKPSWNAFYGTALHHQLQALGITGIVLAGVSTSIGVEGTARAAAELGYNVTIATDALADMVPEAHERSLKYILPRIAELDTTETIVDYLVKG